MSTDRVAVVGTTSDYVALLDERRPGRALFITDQAERAKAAEPSPDAASEVLCDLTDFPAVLSAVQSHLKRYKQRLTGVACFDCESMALASHLARAFGLPYPSLQAVQACRSKFLSKSLWQRAGVPAPQVAIAQSPDEARQLFAKLGGPVVLKPLTGSGSELVFVCRTEAELCDAFHTAQARLAEHPDTRMYARHKGSADNLDPRRVVVLEEFVKGTEYSADFLLESGRASIIRVARKIPAPALSPGTILAYEVPAALPSSVDESALAPVLSAAAAAGGIERSICMADFILRDAQAVFLEIAPRPGGDCLPPLILHAGNFDILGATLDLAEGRLVQVPPRDKWRRCVGLRLFATQEGTIHMIDDRRIRSDARVLECHLKHGPGHTVVLPPLDYESRLLGHVIFQPDEDRPIEVQCGELAAQLNLEIDPSQCATRTS